MGVVFTLAFLFAVVLGVLWLVTGEQVPILTAGAIALFLTSAIQSALDRSWWRSLPAAELQQALRHLRHDGTAPDGAVPGRVVAVPHDRLPAILWNSKLEGRGMRQVSHHSSVVASQPFVVETESDAWLIDTHYVEAAGGRDVDGTFAYQCRLGDNVFLYPAEDVDELAPPWAVAMIGSSGYRSGRVKRLLASAETPVRLLVDVSEMKREAARLRVADASSTASHAEDEEAALEEAALEESEEKRAEIE